MIFSILFLFLIAVVAFLYASVGHGGASGYLALMVIFGFGPDMMKPSALLLNLFVSAISFYQFYRGGFFKWKILTPFIVTSIPLSFIGARLEIETSVYRFILAACLLVAILRLIGLSGNGTGGDRREIHIPLALLVGAVIGLISGMIGIGGGILLSPVLLLLNWASMKETAAVSAIFIFLNSLAGLAGASSALEHLPSEVYVWVLAGIGGGTLGAFYGRKHFNDAVLRYILSIVLIFACVKLIII